MAYVPSLVEFNIQCGMDGTLNLSLPLDGIIVATEADANELGNAVINYINDNMLPVTNVSKSVKGNDHTSPYTDWE